MTTSNFTVRSAALGQKVACCGTMRSSSIPSVLGTNVSVPALPQRMQLL